MVVVIMCDGWREAAAESGKYPCRGVTYAHGVQERDAQVLRESLVPLLSLNVADWGRTKLLHQYVP